MKWLNELRIHIADALFLMIVGCMGLIKKIKKWIYGKGSR